MAYSIKYLWWDWTAILGWVIGEAEIVSGAGMKMI